MAFAILSQTKFDILGDEVKEIDVSELVDISKKHIKKLARNKIIYQISNSQQSKKIKTLWPFFDEAIEDEFTLNSAI